MYFIRLRPEELQAVLHRCPEFADRIREEREEDSSDLANAARDLAGGHDLDVEWGGPVSIVRDDGEGFQGGDYAWVMCWQRVDLPAT